MQLPNKQYIAEIDKFGQPLSVFSVEPSADELHIFCQCPACIQLRCPRCDKEAKKFDNGRSRTVRHINWLHHNVYLHASIPRVQCLVHGVVQIHQSLIPTRGKVSLPMQVWLASQIVDEESANHFAHRLGLSRATIERCIHESIRTYSRERSVR
jgi:transposase